MHKFQLYFERRERNPLRKQELRSQNIDNYAYVQQQKLELPKEKLAQIRKMKELGVEPERIETFKQAKIAEREKELKKTHFRTKLDEPVMIGYVHGIKIFTDKYTTLNFSPGYERRVDIINSVTKLVTEFKDVLPIKKPIIVITDASKNPVTSTKGITGTKFKTAGQYSQRIIYIDQESVKDFYILSHEYAHYIADSIPTEIEPILKEEYTKMLNEYFGRTTKHQSLQGKHNKQHRAAMASKLGLPSSYAAANFHEWFAEIISHWKNLPTTPAGYKFKQVVKKVLNRI